MKKFMWRLDAFFYFLELGYSIKESWSISKKYFDKYFELDMSVEDALDSQYKEYFSQLSMKRE